MGKNISKKIMMVLLVISSLTFFLTFTNEPASAESYNVALSYGEYYAIFSERTMSSDEYIDWSFSASGNVWL